MALHIRHGRWWMFQWGTDILFSIGLHLDRRLRYMDIHLLSIILTLGNIETEYEYYQAWWSSREQG